jgi:hypothetical protein
MIKIVIDQFLTQVKLRLITIYTKSDNVHQYVHIEHKILFFLKTYIKNHTFYDMTYTTPVICHYLFHL